MSTFRQIGGSLLLALFSLALVVGGISLALAESYLPQIPVPTETLTPASFNPGASSTLSPTLALASFTASPPTPSATVPPPTSCPPPAGWIAVMVQPGENLATLASRYQSTSTNLSAANCLFSSDLPVGSIVYVPPVPTQTRVPCGPPPGWVQYIVRSGDTLTSLSQVFGVTLSQLQFANCLAPNQTGLSAGQIIWVPNVATRTPRATATKTLTPVSIVFPTLTWTPSVTPTPTDTPTQTPTPTDTASPTATVPSPTTPPTATSTVTAFPTDTATATPTTPSPGE
jgi:LysM repeat protein